VVGKPAAAPTGANLTLRDSIIRGGGNGIVEYDYDALFTQNVDVGGVLLRALWVTPTSRSNNNHFQQSYFDATCFGANIEFGGTGVKSEQTFTGVWVSAAGDAGPGCGSPVNVYFANQGTYGSIVWTGGRIRQSRGRGMVIDASSLFMAMSGVQFGPGITGPCLQVSTATNQQSMTLTGSTFVGCAGGVDVSIAGSANQFFGTGNRGLGAASCGGPGRLPAAANRFNGGMSGC
jgi:hypothetical protein